MSLFFVVLIATAIGCLLTHFLAPVHSIHVLTLYHAQCKGLCMCSEKGSTFCPHKCPYFHAQSMAKSLAPFPNKECALALQTHLAKQCALADTLASRLAMVDGKVEGTKAAASASQALSKCQRELMDLQAEYNRVRMPLCFSCSGLG